MYRIVSVLMLCCTAYLATAQQKCDIHIDVLVLEKHNAQPLQSVVVHVDELGKTYNTNEKGRLTIDSLCPGSYTLHFHALAYEHYAEKVTVSASTELRFKLAHVKEYMDEVTIATERNTTLLQDKEKLDKAQINANSGKSIGDMLQNINGVSTIANGATIAKPVIHGLHSNRIVMLNNGIRQEDQQWGSMHAPNIDPFMADNITVVKGAASVKYGSDAIGGVVLVDPAPLRSTPGWEGELNLAALSNNRMGVASAIVEHNFKAIQPLSFRLQGTMKKGGNYRIPGHWVANTGVEENNYSATVGWKKYHYGVQVFYSHFNTGIGIYRGSHTGNEDDLNAAIMSDTPMVPADFTYELARPRQQVKHDLIKTRMYLDTKAGMLHMTYGYQHNFRQEFDVLRKENNKAQMNLTLNTQTLNVNLEHKKFLGVDGEVGADAIVQENFIQPGDRLFIPNYRSRGGAGYVIERYKGDDWTLEGGVRYDYRWYEFFNPEGNSGEVVRYELDYQNLSATLGFNHALSSKWKYSLTLSNAWRAPQANELLSSGLHHGAARVEYGNKDLVPERSYNLNVSLEGTVRDRYHIDLSMYSQYIQDYIYLEPGGDLLTIRGYFKTFNYKQANSHLNGADLSLGVDWSDRFKSTFKASGLFARNVEQSDWLILMPSDRLSLNNVYKTDLSQKIKDAFIAVKGQYVARQWRIPANFDQIDFPRPPAGYFLLEAGVGATFMIGKQPMEISLTGMNLLNTRYRDYLDAFRYFIDQPGRNIVFRLRMPFIINN